MSKPLDWLVRWLGCQLRRHRAHAATRSRCRTARPASLQAHAFDAVAGPDRRPGARADQTIEQWLNRDAFAPAALGTFGNAGVGVARAPKYWNVDFSLSKRFVTFGRQYLQVRGEAFNLLNHPNFGPPDRNIQSQTFGTITIDGGRPARRAAGGEVLLLRRTPNFQLPTSKALPTSNFQSCASGLEVGVGP